MGRTETVRPTFGYNTLDRLTSAVVTDGLANYSEIYGYNTTTGNLETKGNLTLEYNDTDHAHAVTDAGVNDYFYDANGNQTTRVIGADTFNLLYDAENRLVEVKKNNSTIATFVYDGDGRRVKSIIGAETSLFVGAHYEITNGTVTKYYFAGASRIAMRTGSTLTYLLSDHLGSTSLTTDASGNLLSEMRYKAWGEVRYDSGVTPTDYTYTGQYSNMGDFGLMFYNARWYDPALGRFAQADSIVPAGVQGWDRYAYTSNNPIRYNDPSGHEPGGHCDRGYCMDERDLTSWMAAVCVDAAESVEIKEIARLNYQANSFTVRELGPEYAANAKNAAFEEFAGLVSNNEKYDVKVGIKDDLGDTIKLGDNWYEYSTAGNILYGFYGLAAGFSKFELHGGAGAAQLNDIVAKGDAPGGPLTLFDTKADYYAIEFGFFLYENYYDDGVLTQSEFLDALAKYEHADQLALVSEPANRRPTPYKHPTNQYYQPQ